MNEQTRQLIFEHMAHATNMQPEATFHFIDALHRWLLSRSVYTYKFDHENGRVNYKPEAWRSALPQMVRQYQEAQPYKLVDDCDILVTYANYLMVLGWNPKALLAVRVLSPQGNEGIDHYVTWVRYRQSWYASDVWSFDTRRALYEVGGHKDPGHLPVDAQEFPFTPDGWKTLELVRAPAEALESEFS